MQVHGLAAPTAADGCRSYSELHAGELEQLAQENKPGVLLVDEGGCLLSTKVCQLPYHAVEFIQFTRASGVRRVLSL